MTGRRPLSHHRYLFPPAPRSVALLVRLPAKSTLASKPLSTCLLSNFCAPRLRCLLRKLVGREDGCVAIMIQRRPLLEFPCDWEEREIGCQKRKRRCVSVRSSIRGSKVELKFLARHPTSQTRVVSFSSLSTSAFPSENSFSHKSLLRSGTCC